MAQLSSARQGKLAEHYVWMRLMQNGMVPYVPAVDDTAVDLAVEIPSGAFAKVQVKSRGFPLRDGEEYGEQIKDLWWTQGEMAFDFLIVVLPKADSTDHESSVLPASFVKDLLTRRGDLSLSRRRLRKEWSGYHEAWERIGSEPTQA